MKKDVKAISPHNLGWLEYELNTQEMDYIWKCIENKKRDYKDNLAGNVSSSHLLMDRSDWFFNNTLLPLTHQYGKLFYNVGKDVPVNRTHPYHLRDLWVNYQKQHEFNPIHTHTGVYSFVIWMKIPTEYNQQRSLPLARANSDVVSNFSFEYTNILGESRTYVYVMSPKAEGTMVFFPSKLTHIVYPYYNCEKERISVSGNISLNTAKVI